MTTTLVRTHTRRKPEKPSVYYDRLRELEAEAARKKPVLELERAILRASIEIRREEER